MPNYTPSVLPGATISSSGTGQAAPEKKGRNFTSTPPNPYGQPRRVGALRSLSLGEEVPTPPASRPLFQPGDNTTVLFFSNTADSVKESYYYLRRQPKSGQSDPPEIWLRKVDKTKFTDNDLPLITDSSPAFWELTPQQQEAAVRTAKKKWPEMSLWPKVANKGIGALGECKRRHHQGTDGTGYPASSGSGYPNLPPEQLTWPKGVPVGPGVGVESTPHQLKRLHRQGTDRTVNLASSGYPDEASGQPTWLNKAVLYYGLEPFTNRGADEALDLASSGYPNQPLEPAWPARIPYGLEVGSAQRELKRLPRQETDGTGYPANPAHFNQPATLPWSYEEAAALRVVATVSRSGQSAARKRIHSRRDSISQGADARGYPANRAHLNQPPPKKLRSQYVEEQKRVEERNQVGLERKEVKRPPEHEHAKRVPQALGLGGFPPLGHLTDLLDAAASFTAGMPTSPPTLPRGPRPYS